jgi:hypothetical protein
VGEGLLRVESLAWVEARSFWRRVIVF